MIAAYGGPADFYARQLISPLPTGVCPDGEEY